MYKTYRFRLYPNSEQIKLMNKTFGCVRFIYNYFLDKCNKNGYIKAFDMCSEIKELYVLYPFLKVVDGCSLRCAVFNLEDAYKNFLINEVLIQNLKVNLINKVTELHVSKVLIKEKSIVIFILI